MSCSCFWLEEEEDGRPPAPAAVGRLVSVLFHFVFGLNVDLFPQEVEEVDLRRSVLPHFRVKTLLA